MHCLAPYGVLVLMDPAEYIAQHIFVYCLWNVFNLMNVATDYLCCCGMSHILNILWSIFLKDFNCFIFHLSLSIHTAFNFVCRRR